MQGLDPPSETTPLARNLHGSGIGYESLRSRSPSATVTVPSDFPPSSEDFQHDRFYSRATMLRPVVHLLRAPPLT